MNPENKIIQSLWVGSNLSSMERLSIESFLRCGHEFHLYTYGSVGNVPDKATIKDANEIIPSLELPISRFPKLALFADFFRYKLLLDKGGWWVDTDTIAIKPFDFEEPYVFSSETLNDGSGMHVNNGIIKVPKNSDIINYCWSKCMEMDIPRMKWGVSGPALMKEAINQFNLREYIQTPQVFCPIPPWDTPKLISAGGELKITQRAYAVHLWNNLWSHYRMDKETFPHGSLYEALKDGSFSKFEVPDVIIRAHMEMPFAAINGMYTGIVSDNMQLIKKFPNAYAAGQSPLMADDLSVVLGKDKVCYLPTRYKFNTESRVFKEDPVYDDVGCFGSLRVLKNQPVQAIAAIKFARARGKKLRFHVNRDFDEAYSPNVLSLLQALFSMTPDAELVLHQWNSSADFQNLLLRMTIGMQVSMTESANNTAKDMVSAGVPMVVSREIKWSVPESNAYPTSSEEIAEKMLYAMEHPELIELNRRNLAAFNEDCFRYWKKVLGGVQNPRVLFLVQKSLKSTGVKHASLEDNRMLAEHGIWSKLVQTDWSDADVKKAIDEHKPTHIVSEAVWYILSAIFHEGPKKAVQTTPVVMPATLAPSPSSLPASNWQKGFLEKKVQDLFQRFRYVVATVPKSAHHKQLCRIYPDHMEEVVDTPEGRRIIFVVEK